MRTTLYLEICKASKLQVKFTTEVWSSRRHFRYRSSWTIEFCGKANWKPKKLWATKLLVGRAGIKRHLLKSSAHSTSPECQESVSLATFRRWVNVFISTDILWKKEKKVRYSPTDVRRAAIKRHLLKSNAHSTSPERQEPVSLATFRRWVNVFISTNILWKKKKEKNGALLTHWCAILGQSKLLDNFFCWGNRSFHSRLWNNIDRVDHFSHLCIVHIFPYLCMSCISLFISAVHIWTPLLGVEKWIQKHP